MSFEIQTTSYFDSEAKRLAKRHRSFVDVHKSTQKGRFFLCIQKEQSEQTMTSLEIAELTGKQHKNVMQAIRNMEPAWEKVQGSKFGLSSKKNGTCMGKSTRVQIWTLVQEEWNLHGKKLTG